MKSRTSVRSESRRIEAKRQRNEYRESLWQKTFRRMSPTVLLIWAGFYIGAVAILLSGSESMPWRLNEIVDRDITARVSFTVEDQFGTDQARQIARATAPNIYVANDAPLEVVRGRLTDLLALAKSSADDKAKFKAETTAKGWTLDDAGFKALQSYTSSEKSQEYDGLVKRLTARLGEQNLVEKAVDHIREAPPPNSILKGDSIERVSRELPTSQLQYLTESNRKYVEQTANKLVDIFPEALRTPVARLVVLTLLGAPGAKEPAYAPLWRYDATSTAVAIDRAEAQVAPIMIAYKKGDPIVRAESVSVLGNQEMYLLKREHEEYLNAEHTDRVLRQHRLLTRLGMAGLVFILTAGLATYTFFYQDRTFEKPARILGLTGLMLLMILLSRLNERAQYPWDLPFEFAVGFVVIAAALLVIAYNQRFAFGLSGGLAILATLASRGDLSLFLTLLTAMGTTVFLLKEVRTRSKIIVVGVIAGVAAMMASVFGGLIEGQELKYVLEHGLAAGTAAIGAGFVVQGIMPQFERMFGIATSMTLLEWCDASRPLLRRLAQEAPGTYSHSLILSQMAEEAAEAIGARGLLARVGALYHDIGKMQKAEYFVENQEANFSRHTRLSPTMSLLIIVGHVKDGIELARAYGLPRILHRFIAEHHGTTVVKYFLQAASEAAKQKGRAAREISESEFRYPGPKPRSRETAILMLCDGCEGAVRSITEPTPGRIECTVHQVVMDRLNDGQFDECDITLRELRVVEQSLVKSLAAVHHSRVKYPKAVSERVAAGADVNRQVDSGSAPGGTAQVPEVVRHA